MTLDRRDLCIFGQAGRRDREPPSVMRGRIGPATTDRPLGAYSPLYLPAIPTVSSLIITVWIVKVVRCHVFSVQHLETARMAWDITIQSTITPVWRHRPAVAVTSPSTQRQAGKTDSKLEARELLAGGRAGGGGRVRGGSVGEWGE
ncbi:hypothetical protein E2C01_023958 [Portunus trituberculatus]|uniref:Uncharacterized protein n=1 Tax=Portunus trituberculatus TaxID=210409 RepID=A0A5B7EAM7_PORTR|nr:hypothetical protein [Portunus trituberculatus]